jgi:hypothetical protein
VSAGCAGAGLFWPVLHLACPCSSSKASGRVAGLKLVAPSLWLFAVLQPKHASRSEHQLWPTDICMLPACASCSGAVQAGLIGFGLFVFATRVEGQVYTSSLPDGYTVSAGPARRQGAWLNG